MMFTRLEPPIPFHVLGKGDGQAIAVIDYGAEHNLIWVTAIDGTGELWCAPNPRVRMQANWTLGRVENRLVARAKSRLAALGEDDRCPACGCARTLPDRNV